MMSEERPSSTWRRVGAIGVWLVLPLIVGVLLSLLVPRPVVGLIYLDYIIDPYMASNMTAQIAYAREHPEVRAVVLVIDSPGGSAIETEAIYLELARLRQTRPVVSVVKEIAASGAYQLAVGTDYIYANPTSEVGGIGVIGLLPPSPAIFEDLITTGPYKGWGVPRDTALRRMELIKRSFYQAVQLGRGESLRASPEVLLRGEVWSGVEAMHMGLVDELGVQSQAVERAARMAHISHYTVVNLVDRVDVPLFSPFFLQSSKEEEPSVREPGLYLLYLPPVEERPFEGR